MPDVVQNILRFTCVYPCRHREVYPRRSRMLAGTESRMLGLLGFGGSVFILVEGCKRQRDWALVVVGLQGTFALGQDLELRASEHGHVGVHLRFRVRVAESLSRSWLHSLSCRSHRLRRQAPAVQMTHTHGTLQAARGLSVPGNELQTHPRSHGRTCCTTAVCFTTGRAAASAAAMAVLVCRVSSEASTVSRDGRRRCELVGLDLLWELASGIDERIRRASWPRG